MLTETLLFVLLSPGLLLTIPPVGKKILASGKTSVAAIAVHAALFAVLLAFRKSIPGLRSLEAFQTEDELAAKETEVVAQRTSQQKARQDLKRTHQDELKALLQKQRGERNALRTTQRDALKATLEAAKAKRLTATTEVTTA